MKLVTILQKRLTRATEVQRGNIVPLSTLSELSEAEKLQYYQHQIELAIERAARAATRERVALW